MSGTTTDRKPHAFIENDTEGANPRWCKECQQSADTYLHASEEERAAFDAQRSTATRPLTPYERFWQQAAVDEATRKRHEAVQGGMSPSRMALILHRAIRSYMGDGVVSAAPVVTGDMRMPGEFQMTTRAGERFRVTVASMAGES